MGNESPETDNAARPGVNWSYRDVDEFVRACFDRDTILDVLMGYSANWFPARMTLIVGRSWVQVFAVEGFDLSDDIDKHLRRADFEPGAPAVESTETIGTADDIGLGDLFGQLGLDAGPLKSIGIEIGGRVAIIIVGALRAMEIDTTRLADAAASAGVQLEKVIRMAKGGTLPPEADRIPPFPGSSRGAEGETRKAPVLPDITRRTQQLKPLAPGNTIAGPHFRPAQDNFGGMDEEMDDLVPNATSFGLPFATKVLAPGKTLLERSAGVDTAEEDRDEDERREADIVRRSIPSETYVGAPTFDEKFPGELDPDDSAGRGQARDTKMGGLLAEPTVVGKRPSRQAETRKVGSSTIAAAPGRIPVSTPHASPHETTTPTRPGTLERPDASSPPRNDAASTDLGGLQGETRLVNRTLERARGKDPETISRPPGEELIEAPPEAPESPAAESSAAWVNPSTTGKANLPGAMILKPARKRRRPDGDESSSASTSAPPGSRLPTGTGEGSEGPAKKTAKQQPFRTEQPTPRRDTFSPKTVPGTQPRKSHSDRSNDDATKVSWGREDLTRVAPEPVEPSGDDWFNYFADEVAASPAAQPAIDPFDFELSEVSEVESHSLPPETMERLLESGPQMVDMQEDFLVLDSRDRVKAFEAAERVAEVGRATLDVLDLMFPGRIFIDRYQHPDELPPVNEHGPLLHALVRIGDQAVEVARRHINDASNETRFYATFLFTRLSAEGVLADLFARLFDRDTQVRKMAADILLDYQKTPDFDRDVRKPLRAELLSGEDFHVEVAARLIGRLRDPDAVIALIDTMEETESPRVRQAVRDALKVVTLHDWSSPYEWRHWWEKGRLESRHTWIAEALDAPGADLRQLAFEEVRRIPGLELNYHPDQPPKLRQRAQKELRSWLKLHER